jgi:uncharacterized cupin superfamily protein
MVSKANDVQKQKTANWSAWEKEPSTFAYEYPECETFYVLEGKAEIVTNTGDKCSFSVGDWVIIPRGTICNWTISEKIKKKYKFG